jgi:hypothetical protein
VRSRAVIAFVALLALGCSPELDWRELRSTEGGFSALMPARPRYEVRRLSGASAVAMHLWSARAAKSVFGVGYADYIAAVDLRTLDDTRDALVRNIGGRLLEERPIEQIGLTGREFVAESRDVLLRARLLVSGARLYQLAVLGERNAVAAADIELFLSSFRPAARAPAN